MNNIKDEKDFLRELEKSSEIPERLKPENIEKLLEQNKRKIKISHTSMAKRIISACAAVAVICAGTFTYLHFNKQPETNSTSVSDKKEKTDKTDNSEKKDISGLETKSYKEIFDYMKNNAQDSYGMYETGGKGSSTATNEVAEDESDLQSSEHSKTYLQEEGVDESDIVKTDGDNIFYVNFDDYCELVCIHTDNGKMERVDVDFASLYDTGFDVTDVSAMYLEDDVLTLCVNGFNDYEYNGIINENSEMENVSCTTVVSLDVSDIYDIREITRFTQQGFYNDSRMIDGKLYLVTNYSNYSFDEYDTNPDFVPRVSVCGEMQYIPAEDIYFPVGTDAANYAVVSEIDTMKKDSLVSTKAVVSNWGTVYSSKDSIYVCDNVYDYSDENSLTVSSNSFFSVYTNLVKFDISDDGCEISGSVKTDGYINDQYSLHEENGVLFVALTDTNNDKMTNRLVSFDSNLNELGRTEDFGDDENIKSVTYKNNTAYVVTFMLTDPLFKIDLSDPSEPVVTDQLKLSGFSTNMRTFSQDRVFGFGYTADDTTGMTTGIKMSMFKTDGLTELANYEIKEDDNYYVYSQALYDEKALLVDSEKNIIAFPYEIAKNNDINYGFDFFSYSDENGFELTGSVNRIFDNSTDEYNNFSRALYIGDYIYVIGNAEAVSVSMGDFSEVQSLSL